MKVKWRLVPEFNGLYRVSTTGLLESRTLYDKWVRLKQHSNKKGYKCVTLYKDKKQYKFLAHRLIALVFLKNPKNKEQVNHKNGIKWDNRLDNLEWATQSENQRHSFDVLKTKPTNLGKKGALSHLAVAINQIDLSTGEIIQTHKSIVGAAEKLGGCPISICAALKGRNKTASGFKWEYA